MNVLRAARVGHLDPDIGAPGLTVRGVRRPAVRLGDGADDREPEARTAARPRLVRPREPLERTPEELRWEPLALVADVQLDHAVVPGREEGHRAAPVTERVVDQIRKRLLEP